MEKSSRKLHLTVTLYSALLLVCSTSLQALPTSNESDWPVYSHDYSNTNHNPTERKLTKTTVKYLTRAWETFNDDRESQENPPTDFDCFTINL